MINPQVPLTPVDADAPAADIDAIAAQIVAELRTAQADWPPFNSAHEGLSILAEEMRELKLCVFTNQRRRDLAAMRAEAIQVAAMAMRFVVDICDGGRARK